jgi:hypothetical protein
MVDDSEDRRRLEHEIKAKNKLEKKKLKKKEYNRKKKETL